VFPQGGSTITHTGARYFLSCHKLTTLKKPHTLQPQVLFPHVSAFAIGVPGANRMLRKVEGKCSRVVDEG